MLVNIESPFAGDVENNIRYARQCMKDCLLRGEYPIASHLLYTQEGILDDTIEEERNLGITAGLEWNKCAEKTVVYIDRGVSNGMMWGVKSAFENNRLVEIRSLTDYMEPTIANERFWNNYLNTLKRQGNLEIGGEIIESEEVDGVKVITKFDLKEISIIPEA